MNDQAKTEQSGGECSRGVSWYPLRKWWQSSRIFNRDADVLPLLEPWDSRWMPVDWLQKSLEAGSWPGNMPALLSVPYICGSANIPSQKINKEQYRWRVSLDVAHFSPSEISLRVTDGFLEVRGEHEERPDEHGFITRCFTRKYRLLAEIDATKIVSSLSADGILTVEAPVPETTIPEVTIIPIKVEMEITGEEQEKEEASDTHPENLPSAEDEGEGTPPGVLGDQAHPGSSITGLQQHEEQREQEEETSKRPIEESLPSEPADGEGTEDLQDFPKHREILESRQSVDTDTTEQLEHEEPMVDKEVQVMGGSGEAAEEIAQPLEPRLGMNPQSEVPSQELKDPDVKQECTE